MLNFTCIMISGVDLAFYAVSRAKNVIQCPLLLNYTSIMYDTLSTIQMFVEAMITLHVLVLDNVIRKHSCTIFRHTLLNICVDVVRVMFFVA